MAHARQTIRERLATLVTGLATTGANVFQSRVHSVQDSELPCLLVYSTSELIEQDTLGSPRDLTRTLDVIVEGIAKATSDLDDTLDTISEEVETVVGADSTLNIGVLDCLITGTQIEYEAGNQPVGSVQMTFTITYRAAENAPGTIV